VEVVSISLGPKGGEVLDLQVAWLFEIVIIGNKVRILLGKSRWRRACGQQRNAKKAKQNESNRTRTQDLLASYLQQETRLIQFLYHLQMIFI